MTFVYPLVSKAGAEVIGGADVIGICLSTRWTGPAGSVVVAYSDRSLEKSTPESIFFTIYLLCCCPEKQLNLKQP